MQKYDELKIKFTPDRFYQCYRCGEIKDWYRFNDGQFYWYYVCIRCEKSPSGNFPIQQTEEHRRDK